MRWRRLTSRRALMLPVAAVLGAALIAAVPVTAAKPVREVVALDTPRVIPAGFGCAFDVGLQPSENARQTITEFSDGRIVTIGHAEPTLTNLETGTSFVQRSRYQATDTYDPDANDLFVEVSGRFLLYLFPGDQGPSGEVGEDGALIAVEGHAEYVVDLDTGFLTSLSLVGQTADVCALLSG